MTARDVERVLRALSPVDAVQTEALWSLWVASAGAERGLTSELLDVVVWQAVAKDYRAQVWCPPPGVAVCAGEYPLGVVLYPGVSPYAALGVREAEWIRHVVIVGTTGSGKTNLAFHLVRGLWQAGKPWLVFDWKRSYRDLRQLPDLRDVVVVTVARDVVPFHFNPLLPPPGMFAGEWLGKLVDVLKHAYFVGDGVEYVLRRAMDAVYETTGLLAGKPDARPTFLQVKQVVERTRLEGRMSLWKASAVRVLESLCWRHGLGPVVNGPTWNYADLLARPVVLELDALADADKVFLTEALILWLYEYRKRHAVRDVFAHALVLEEAHHVLSAAKERAAGSETIMETCLRQIREFGEAVLVLDQEPSKLSHSIRANTATKISLALGTGRDIAEMASALGLDAETTPWLGRLPIGHGLMTLHPRITQPVQVRFPFVALRKGVVTDAALAGLHTR